MERVCIEIPDVADVRVHSVARDQIHWAPEQFRQLIFTFEEGESRSSPGLEFVQQVNIAIAPAVSTAD